MSTNENRGKNKKEAKVKKGRFEHFISGVERVGNKLPTPFWLFTILIFVVIVLSAILSHFGVSVVTNLMKDGTLVETEVVVKNLATRETYNNYLGNLTGIYVNFAPLGQLILMVMSVGFAEKTGFFSAFMRKSVIGAPIGIVVFILAFIGVNSSIGFGAGVVFSMVIGAATFKALGMHPWIGIMLGYASANGGFTANISPTSVDTMLSAITTDVAAKNGIAAPTHPLINYYFIVTATFVLTFVAVAVTTKFVIPYLQKDMPKLELDQSELDKQKLTPEENRGLRYALIAFIAFIIVMLALTLPSNAVLRNADGGFVPSSPLLQQIVTILFFLFFFIGIAYGMGSKVIQKASDIPKLLENSLGMAATFMVVSLPASIFVKLFSESNIATVMAVNGAKFLESAGIQGMTLFILITLLTFVMNMFITSNSAKWVMFAPFLLPMLAYLNVSPAFTQILYRIGDSCGNTISPVELNVPIALGLMESYKIRSSDKVGIGSLISIQLPYCIAFLVSLLLLVAVWYIFNLPLGPGATMFLR